MMKKEADGFAACDASDVVDGEQPAASRGEVVLLFPGRADHQRGCDVDRINQYAFYDLGNIFKQFFKAEQDVATGSVFFEVMQARSSLGRLLKDGEPIQLGLSRGPAENLLKVLNDIYAEHFMEEKDGKQHYRFPVESDPPIPAWRWNYIGHALERFETVFQEEMREAATYHVPRRGIYWTPALVDSAHETFPADVRGHIPPKALDEWRGAGRCLAFGLLSASGFHVARAVEGTMEAYHALFCGAGGKTMKTWNDYIEALAAIDQGTRPLPTPKILDELRQMKENYRNPIMHPRVVLTEPDARMLFNDGESVIIAMAQEMKTVGDRAQPTLALVTPDEGQSPAGRAEDG